MSQRSIGLCGESRHRCASGPTKSDFSAALPFGTLGMASPTRSAMQSLTPNSTAAHMNASFACSSRDIIGVMTCPQMIHSCPAWACKSKSNS